MGMHSSLTPVEKRRDEHAKEIELYNFIQMLKEHHVNVFLTVFLGFDHQGPGIFEEILSFAKRMEVDCAEFTLATPFPGTPFYNSLEKQGRLLHKDWERYNCGHVVFRPKNMKPDQLLEGYLMCWKEFYRGLDEERLGLFELQYIGKIAGSP